MNSARLATALVNGRHRILVISRGGLVKRASPAMVHAADRDAQAEASWQQRAVNAEEELKAAHAEIRAQRTRIGELLGQLRDTQHDHDGDAAQRLATENTALKQRIRDLTVTNRTLEERLQATRSNNRFLDKRIAGLEAQLLGTAPG